MGPKPYQEKILVSRADDERAILSMLKADFSSGRNPRLSLLSVLRGIPISNNAELCDVNDKYAEFMTSPLQIVAIQFTSEAIIRMPPGNKAVIGRLNYIDDTRNIVSLKEFSFADVYIDKRMSVRVQLQPPLGVLLDVDGNRISGDIWDISLDGCNMSTVAGALLEQAHSIILNLKFMHNDAVRVIGIPARVLRIQGDFPGSCIMLFEHTTETENTLSCFLNQRQVEIIRQLKGTMLKSQVVEGVP